MTAHRHFKKTHEGGRWSPSFSNEQFINVLGSPGNFMSTRKVADKLKCSIPLAQKRLKELHAAGEIAGEKQGHMWMYWAVSDEVK